MDLSVVVPCYNEEESVAALYKRLAAVCLEAKVTSYEIILVNDGSQDGTLEIMKSLSAKDSNLMVVNLSRNHGHQLALSAGLSEAKGDYIFVLDADLQDPPELLHPMLERAKSGVDVVYGQRKHRKGETWFKLATATAFYRMLSFLSDTKIPENVGDFRLITRRVLDQLLSMPEQQRFIRGMIAWIGFRQEPFLYERDPRFAGVTKYPLIKLIHFAFDAITSFSIRPLRLAIPLSILGAFLAFLLGSYAILSYFFLDGTFPGWASLASIITFFSAAQLLCIALVGEYVGRAYIEVKRRPLFIVAEVIQNKEKPTATAKTQKTTTKASSAKKSASKKAAPKKKSAPSKSTATKPKAATPTKTQTKS